MSNFPFNLKLSDSTLAVEVNGKVIGFVWPVVVPLFHVKNSPKKRARKYKRWGSCMLDGLVVSRNSRTPIEATRTLRSAIARRIKVGANRASPYKRIIKPICSIDRGGLAKLHSGISGFSA